MDNKVLLIVGMHRSGTSLLAQWLHRCGLNLGDVLLKGDFSNEDGHYEDQEILNLHKDLLIHNGLDATGLFLTKQIVINEYFKKRIKYSLQLKNELRSQWGFKEPRTCLLLPEYLELMPNAKLLVVYRSFEEVVMSLVKRDIERYVHSIKSSGRWALLGYYLNGSKNIRAIAKANVLGYANAWLEYNKKIVAALETINEENFVVFPLSAIQDKEEKMFDKLLNWGFELEKIAIASLYKKERLNASNIHVSISQLNLSDSMIKEAKNLEKRLLAYSLR